MSYKFSKALTQMSGTATREIFKLAARPEVISFAGGLPASDTLPVAKVAEITQEIFADPDEALRCLQYSVTEGYPGFRETIIDMVGDLGFTGLTPDNVLVTSGGGQGLDLLCKSFLDAGDVVLVEKPTFLGFLQTLNSYNADTVGVAADFDGIDIADLEAKLARYHPKLIYTIPTFSNPTGKTWPLEKRRAVIALAKQYGAIVIEDDPYGRLRFSGKAVTSMAALDTDGVCVYLSSFSKTISPGLRTGFAIGPAEIIRKMAIGKQGVDLHTSCLSQLIIKRYIEKGYLLPNIEKSIPLYRARKEAMIAALDRYMPAGFRHTDPSGGLFIWGEFEAPINTLDYFPAAIKENVAFIQGSVFYPDGSGDGLNTLRLNYSNESPERIEAGIAALGRTFAGV